MKCQSCSNTKLHSILSLGYLPPVNDFRNIGEEAGAQSWMPTDLMYCDKCELVQLAYTGDQNIIFPPAYPYTSGTTKILRDNFADLAREARQLVDFDSDDLVIDIGSNDGTLLRSFIRQVEASPDLLGIEPTDIADKAKASGIPTIKNFFSKDFALKLWQEKKLQAKLITCANCFAHMPDVNDVIEGVLALLAPEGVFVTESTYLIDTLDKVQYDTIYHEHLRYYSLLSLKNLLNSHGLHVFYAKKIPTHGGSIRVYARRGSMWQSDAIDVALSNEACGARMLKKLYRFAAETRLSKLSLMERLYKIKLNGDRVVGISAPSRSATVINYCKLDNSIVDYIVEVKGSLKIGKYMPGTDIPVIEEDNLIKDQPEYAILFSWHIADEVMSSLRRKGYRGKFIHPIGGMIIEDRMAA